MATGGKRPGAGRPAGARNKKTSELMKRVEESGLTPLEYMVAVMRDEANAPEIRLDAARSAAPYVHARLASSEVSIMKPGDELTEEQIMGQIRSILEANPSLKSFLGFPH